MWRTEFCGWDRHNSLPEWGVYHIPILFPVMSVHVNTGEKKKNNKTVLNLCRHQWATWSITLTSLADTERWMVLISTRLFQEQNLFLDSYTKCIKITAIILNKAVYGCAVWTMIMWTTARKISFTIWEDSARSFFGKSLKGV